MSRIAVTLGYFALAFAFGGGPAWACGGFFCQTQPIDQAGEKVIFGVDQDKGELVAIIQIQYTGSAENFSWVIPTPVVPTVGVSSDELFGRLGPPTRPQFRLKYKTEGTCREGGIATTTGGLGAALSPTSARNAADGVQVISQEKVGPFDATVLLPDDSEALVKWLKQNDYRIPDTFGPLSAPYVQQKNYFVALKLQSDKDAGDLRPVVLRMKERYPCVPIRLTAIAATENMPVILWIFGKSRAIPTNYLHVKLNEALVDWVGAFGGPAPNYDAVVTQSMKEAGGNGFVTDYAGSSSAFKGALGYSYDTTKLAGISGPPAFMQEVRLQGFPRGGLMQNILRDYLPLPQEVQAQGVTETSWWNGLFFGTTFGASESAFVKFDAQKFAADLDTTFVQPLKEANEFIDRMPYLTRLYTTMSPKDMENKDPLFAFNSKLGDVSNIHEADATVLCSANYYQWEAPYRIKLQDGTEFTLEKGDAGRGYAPLALTSMPAAFRIEQLAEESDTTLLTDNKPKIDEILRSQPAPQAGAAAKNADYGALGCACRPPGAANRVADAPGSDMEAALWGVTLGSLVWWRRRRKP